MLHTNGTAVTKYLLDSIVSNLRFLGVQNQCTNHLIGGSFWKVSTFMPKKPTRNVSGKKMKVIQLSLQRLVFSSTDFRASRMLTDLYI